MLFMKALSKFFIVEPRFVVKREGFRPSPFYLSLSLSLSLSVDDQSKARPRFKDLLPLL